MKFKGIVALGGTTAAALAVAGATAPNSSGAPANVGASVRTASTCAGTSVDKRANVGIPLPIAGSGPQSFAYDNGANVIYVAQAKSASAPDLHNGNLAISQYDNARPHKALGKPMILEGFGHGTSIAVEPNPASVGKPKNAWIWVEIAPAPSNDPKHPGFGTMIARVYYRHGYTIKRDRATGKITSFDAAGKPHRVPVPIRKPVGNDADTVSPTIDPVSNRMMIRYKTARDRRPRFAIFSLADIKDGAPYRRLATVPQPTFGANDWFQGFAFTGNRLYMLTGSSRHNNAKITTMNLSKPYRPVTTNTTIDERACYPVAEPEGMAIRVLPDGSRRVRWGLRVGTSPHWRLAIYSRSAN